LNHKDDEIVEEILAKMPKTVLIFEAHSDDAVIGMGCLMKRLSNAGTKVVACTVTTGETAHSMDNKDDIVEIRRREGRCADKILGVHEHIFLAHPCQDVRNDKKTFHEFVKIIRDIKPDWIFTHGPQERHRDHRAISQLTEEAWWKATEQNVLPELGHPFKAGKVLFYEVLPMFDDDADVCIDATPYWDAKLDALNCFESQMATMGDFEGLVVGKARYRGYLIGTTFAEALIYSTFMPRSGF